MADSYVLWLATEGQRVRIGATNARYRPPFGVKVITIVEACDLVNMRRWCKTRLKEGWTLESMREECGEGL